MVVNVHETHRQGREMFLKYFDIFITIEKKKMGNGIYIHDTKSLYATPNAGSYLSHLYFVKPRVRTCCAARTKATTYF